jgi:hypothetical protein
MKENNWDDCLISNSTRIITPDLKRAQSLIEVAYERINLIKEINEKNSNFIFEDYYASLTEIIQSKTFKNGFNIMNHICLGYYIRDVLKRDDLYRIFDDLRFKRNSLTYYGNRMEFEIAKEAIRKCKFLIKELGKS